MSKKTVKDRIQFYSVLFMSVVVFAAVFICLFVSKISNKKKNQAELIQTASQKNLEFQADLNSQIILALQMSKSPSVIEYCLNPEDDDLFDNAIKEFSAYQDSFLGKTTFFVSSKNHKFYSDLKYSYTVDPANPDDYWYSMTINDTPLYNFNINYNKELDKTMLWLNVVVKDSKSNPIGVAGTGIPISDFINDMYDRIPPYMEMYLYNDRLEITGARDFRILSDKVSILSYFENLDEEKALCKKVTNISMPEGEFVLAPIDVIGWNLLLFIPSHFSDYFTKDGIVPSIVMILISVVIIAVYLFLFQNVLLKTTSHLDKTKLKASEQVELMDQVNSTIAENIDYLKQFEQLIKNQISQIETSVENTSELSSSLESINTLRKDSLASTNDLTESSERGNSHIANITIKIEELNECTKRLSSANNLIASITSKTNLLAMNASIEASHAGEHGKGFAVVAKEIRSLAEKSRAQQQDVRYAIDNINSMVAEMVQYSQVAMESFKEIVSNTQKVQDNFLNMSDKLETEASIVQTISANLQSVSTTSQKINMSFSEMKSSNEQIEKEISSALDSSNELLVITDDLLNSIDKNNQ